MDDYDRDMYIFNKKFKISTIHNKTDEYINVPIAFFSANVNMPVVTLENL